MKRHWYTIEVSQNGLVWYIVGKYKFYDVAQKHMDDMMGKGKWDGYTYRIGLR